MCVRQREGASGGRAALNDRDTYFLGTGRCTAAAAATSTSTRCRSTSLSMDTGEVDLGSSAVRRQTDLVDRWGFPGGPNSPARFVAAALAARGVFIAGRSS